MQIHDQKLKPTLQIAQETESELCLSIAGPLANNSLQHIWQETATLLDKTPHKDIKIDASGVSYCDTAGIGLFITAMHVQRQRNKKCEIRGLHEDTEKLLEVFVGQGIDLQGRIAEPKKNFLEGLGEWGALFYHDLCLQISFSGELVVKLFKALFNPRLFRWQDVWHFVEYGGIQALPIVLSLSFLMGLIMAFQAAIPMRQFGADVFVADLVSLSILRELGPLMTAVILAGRTGSSFAAEIGTMKVNEELDALSTMGLNPVSFLVINRVFAVIIFMPVLTILADLAGLIGGAVVFRSLGYPIVTYCNQIMSAVSMGDFLGGFVKSFVFAILIASIGCLRGLETKSGASAVGISATRAVVSGLTLIVVVDGIFSIIYYYLGI